MRRFVVQSEGSENTALITQSLLLRTFLSVFGHGLLPTPDSAFLPGIAASWLCLVGKRVAHSFAYTIAAKGDERAAHAVFSWGWFASLLFTWGLLGAAQFATESRFRMFPSSDCPATALVIGTILWLIHAFYQSYLAIATAPRLLSNLVIVFSMGAIHPSYSTLGQPAELLLTLTAPLLAELAARTVEAHQRTAKAVLLLFHTLWKDLCVSAREALHRRMNSNVPAAKANLDKRTYVGGNFYFRLAL
eukprot:gene4528-1282_t